MRTAASALLSPLLAVAACAPLIVLTERAVSFDIVALDLELAPWLGGLLTGLAWLLLAWITAGLVGAPAWWLTGLALAGRPARPYAAAALADVAAVLLFLRSVPWQVPAREIAWLATLGGAFLLLTFALHARLSAPPAPRAPGPARP